MRVGVIAEQLRQEVPGGIGTYVRGLLSGLAALDEPMLRLTALTSRAPSPDPLASLGVEIDASRFGHHVLMALWDRGLNRPRRSFDMLHLTSLAAVLAGMRRPTAASAVHRQR
jgi:hypothetical protein